MIRHIGIALTALAISSTSATGAISGSGSNEVGKLDILDVESGSVSFTLATNIPAIEVSGKSKSVQVRVLLHRETNGISTERIEASMPIKSLQTGMALRDEHMRKLIFTTPEGETPDLHFESGRTRCLGVVPGQDATCSVLGNLTLRGVSRPFVLPMKVRLDNGGTSFRATGEGVVKLSDYGIAQPTQLGVKGSNEVKLRLDLTGRPSKQMMTSSSAWRPE